LRKQFEAEEAKLRITAPIDPVAGGRKDRKGAAPGEVSDPLGEEVFEKEMEKPWKRED